MDSVRMEHTHPMEGSRTAEPQIGGRLCLDFVNALEEWGASYAALAAWGERAGLLSPEEAERLAVFAAGDPAALRTLREAVTLRHALYQVFSAIASGRAPAPRAFATLNDSLAHALSKLRLVASPRGTITWAWAGDPGGSGGSGALDRLLWPIVRDAAELLTETERDRVRECDGADCDRLFVDRSRNRSRRWCEMAHCGMLVKSRRHYARTRAVRVGAAGATRAVRAAIPTGRATGLEELEEMEETR